MWRDEGHCSVRSDFADAGILSEVDATCFASSEDTALIYRSGPTCDRSDESMGSSDARPPSFESQ
jgi:hypothetical protein